MVNQLLLIKSSEVVTVRTGEISDTILAVRHKRGDDWADVIQARILHVHDLHAADAAYHRVCSVNVHTMKKNQQAAQRFINIIYLATT